MMIIVNYLLFCILLVGCNSGKITSNSKIIYPDATERIESKVNTTYFIDPNNGSDNNLGTIKSEPWKTFKRVNQLLLTKGNRVEILSAGVFRESLVLIGSGTKEFPITVQFAPGKYNFYPQNAFKRKFHISNTNDAPDSLKAIAFYLLNSEFINIKANGADVVFRGKVMEMCIDNCENIIIDGISFDYQRPTVSELKVLSVNDHFVDVNIHVDSKYKIVDSSLVWIGEGWQHKAKSLWQSFNPNTQRLRRQNIFVNNMRFSELSENEVRIHFDKNPGFTERFIYQNRNTFRDYSAIFMQRSKNIIWENVNIYFMHGMGFVSQFCENITYDSLYVGPRKEKGRTCAAWADILHFSSCKGKIEVKNSYLSAANDDAINVHGTYLRIVDIISKQKIKVHFMHPQTFGFDAFQAGDSIEFINSKSLLPYSKNLVTKANKLNEKEIELTLNQDVPSDVKLKDVIENITWTPDIHITNSIITHIPTRGILVTTRGKIVIENNEILKTNMSGILIANDANNWFESGFVQNAIIRNNKFIKCGEPVINIHPENSEIIEGYPVHTNIQITNNQFKLKNKLLLSAKSTKNIRFTNNTIEVDQDIEVNNLLNLLTCSKIEIEGNSILNSKNDNLNK